MSAPGAPAPAAPGSNWRGLPALHGAVLLFGLAGLFGKWVAAHPVLIVFGRVLVASLVFAVLIRLLPRPARGPSLPERWRLLGCGALLALHWFAFFHAIQLSTVAVALLAYSTAPVFVALLEPAWFREPFSWRALACAGITVGGVALIVPHWSLTDAQSAGVGWGVAAGLSFAVLSLLNRGLVRHHGSIRLAFYQDAIAMVLLAPLLPLVWQPLGWREVALLGVLGIFCTALAHALFIRALASVTARLAAIASALEPVYGITLAWLLLGENPAPRTLAGGGLILAAVLWASLSPSASRPEKGLAG